MGSVGTVAVPDTWASSDGASEGGGLDLNPAKAAPRVPGPGPGTPPRGLNLRSGPATIEYDLPADGNVSLGVFDVLGRKLVMLVNASQNAGTHRLNWDSSALPSGMYFCRLAIGARSVTRDLRITR